MSIHDDLEALFEAAIAAATADGTLTFDGTVSPSLERPREKGNGDWASTVALRCAKIAHAAPRDIATAIVGHLPDNDLIADVEIAGPGFINVTLAEAALQGIVAEARTLKDGFGRGTLDTPCKVNLEYISANPTGPMHVGHGRWAALGDATARVLRHAGYTVDEEFYVNDHGTQMDVFGNSVSVRYQQLLGRDVEMPEQCYAGAYVGDIAQSIIDTDGSKWLDVDDMERLVEFRERAYALMLADQKRICTLFGTTFDRWFSERDLYVKDADGVDAVDRALKVMSDAGYVYESEGATWFRSSDLGDDKDRVLIKANGEYTYFTSDMAYHYDKVRRGFDKLIDIWGADHHGYIARCQAMMRAWGYPDTLEVMLGQLVNLFRDGKPVRMSKRTGEMITFEELIDEVGVDATRYLMLSRSSDQPIDFDIEVAKKKDATNPVYYVQYAHARICSIIRRAADPQRAAAVEDGSLSMDDLVVEIVPDRVDLSVLTHPAERALMSKMDEFAELVEAAARDRAAFRFTHYAQDLAALFHAFYTECRVLDDDAALRDARLALCDASRIVLALSLSLLGVSAPVKM